MPIKTKIHTFTPTSVTVNEYFCDDCDSACLYILNNTLYTCSICKCILCSKCVVFDPREYGDYPQKFCQRCWKVGEKYRKYINEEMDRCDETITQLEKDWYNQAKSTKIIGLIN